MRTITGFKEDIRIGSKRKYLVKDNYLFNLDSMREHALVLIDQIRDGEIEEPVTLMGKEMDDRDLAWLVEEIEGLISKIHQYGRVTGSEYNRIKEISDERNNIRYGICKRVGMSEEEAALAFYD